LIRTVNPENSYLLCNVFKFMAGKARFTCRGEEHHIDDYDMPDESVERFAERTKCKKCGERIDFTPDNI